MILLSEDISVSFVGCESRRGGRFDKADGLATVRVLCDLLNGPRGTLGSASSVEPSFFWFSERREGGRDEAVLVPERIAYEMVGTKKPWTLLALRLRDALRRASRSSLALLSQLMSSRDRSRHH